MATSVPFLPSREMGLREGREELCLKQPEENGLRHKADAGLQLQHAEDSGNEATLAL
jgi:hypothetical protein